MRTEERIILGGGDSRKKRLGAIHGKIRRGLALSGIVFLVIWSLSASKSQMRVRQAHLDISRISHAARLFRADFQRCPDDIDELVKPPEGAAYLQPLIDPWGNPYRMVCPAWHDENDVQIISDGPDGHPLGRDNISTLHISGTP